MRWAVVLGILAALAATVAGFWAPERASGRASEARPLAPRSEDGRATEASSDSALAESRGSVRWKAALLARADAAFSRDAWDLAGDCLRAILEADPDDARVHRLLDALHARLRERPGDEPSDAREAWHRALANETPG